MIFLISTQESKPLGKLVRRARLATVATYLLRNHCWTCMCEHDLTKPSFFVYCVLFCPMHWALLSVCSVLDGYHACLTLNQAVWVSELARVTEWSSLLRLQYTFRSAIFFKFGFLVQSNGRRVIFNFWKQNWKKPIIGGEMEVLRYGQK